MDERVEQLPELGTKAAAVAGIESLIHTALRVQGAPEPLQLRYWLDAYYQARLAEEREGRDNGPKYRSTLKVGLNGEFEAKVEEVAGAGTFASAAGGGRSERKGVAAAPLAGCESGPGAAMRQQELSAPPEQGAVAEGQDEEPISTATKEDAKPKRQRPVGWTDSFEPYEPKKASPAAKAAAYKRQQFERLQKALREGVTMQRIIKAANGNISEDQILGIRECKRVPVAVYDVLAAALDLIEKT